MTDRCLRRWRVLLALALMAGACVAWAEDSQYQVEIIVFQRLAPPETSSLPVLPDQPAADIESTDLTPVPSEHLLLAGAARRLARTGVYRVLLHLGWRQSAAEGRAMRINSSSGDAAAGVEGIARLRVGKQLAFSAALTCKGDGQVGQLRADRIVRLGELHYVDHPSCGMLVQVTRVAAPGE